MKLYYVSLTFHYTKKKNMKNFEDLFEHEVCPLLNPLVNVACSQIKQFSP